MTHLEIAGYQPLFLGTDVVLSFLLPNLLVEKTD
jgi:hypothetical protein